MRLLPHPPPPFGENPAVTGVAFLYATTSKGRWGTDASGLLRTRGPSAAAYLETVTDGARAAEEETGAAAANHRDEGNPLGGLRPAGEPARGRNEPRA